VVVDPLFLRKRRKIATGTNGLFYLIAVPAQSAELNLLAAQNITDFGVSMTAADFTGYLLAMDRNRADIPRHRAGTDSVPTV
jgi:phosphoenolpyruvate-protein kinase (PTS system EI component)